MLEKKNVAPAGARAYIRGRRRRENVVAGGGNRESRKEQEKTD